MSTSEKRAPLSVTLRDGSVWERRGVDRQGAGLYALEGSVAECPDVVLASLAELAEIGIRPVAGAASYTPADAAAEALAERRRVEGPHDSPLHHSYETCRDLPERGVTP